MLAKKFEKDFIGFIFLDVAVLDMTQAANNLTWYVPQITGTSPPGMYSHTGVMVGTTMLLLFGEPQIYIIVELKRSKGQNL